MASNEVSIKVSTDGRKAAQDFDKLRSSIKLLDQEARRLGTGFTAGASQAEAAMTRLQSRVARLRAEIAHTQAASRNLGGNGPVGGTVGPFGSGGLAGVRGGGGLGVGAAFAIGAAAVGAGYSGYQEAREQAQAQSYLANASKQAGQAFAVQAGEAAKLRRELGLTTAQAQQLQAASLRFTNTIGRPGEASKLTKALANALAASGRGTDEIPDSLRQLATGQDELFDKLGPVKIGKTYAGSPETIYRAYAKEILNVKRELTDLEKTQARYYAVLQAGAAAEGAAAERMSSSVGQIDRLKNAYSDLLGTMATSVMKSQEFTAGLSTAAKTAELLTFAIEKLAAAEAKRKPLGPNASAVEKAIDWSVNHPSRRYQGIAGPLVAAYDYFATQQDKNYAALEQLRAGPMSGGARIDSILGSVGGAFGLTVGSPLARAQAVLQRATSPEALIAGAQRYLNPGQTGLDNPFYLSRDPFSGKSLADQNREAQYKFGMAGLRSAVPGIAAGFASPFSGIVSAGDRLAGLSIGGETAQARAARIFSVAGSVQTAAAEAYRIGGYSAGEAASMAESEARRFRIASLGNVGPGELTADQEAAYREDLKRYQEDQLKTVRDQLIELTKSRKALEKLANKLAPDEFVEPEPITMVIENRADVVARFAAIATGDSLRNDQ